MRRDRGLTLVEVLVASMALIVLASLLIPAWVRSRRHAKLVACRGNLEALFQAQAAAPPVERPPLGGAYWARLAKSAPPLIDPARLRCPMATPGAARESDYLGPKQDPSGLKPGDPLGCDDEHNHGEHGREGGNVLYKSGEVRTLHPREPGTVGDPWREAYQEKCSP